MVTSRAFVGGALLLLWLPMGCGRGPSTDIPEGCTSGDQVPAAVRRALEDGARGLFDRARKGEWAAIYEGASTAVRAKNSQEAFVTPISRTLREMGLPADLQTESISVIRFGSGFPSRSRVECAEPGKELASTLLLTEFPLQASVVQRGGLGSEQVYFSTLWHGEDSGWKLAGFFAKPATLVGKDWRAYDSLAAAEFDAKRKRNAALLYNVAIDLVVPNAWTKPGDVAVMEGKQGHISVTALPRGAPDVWPAPPDTFRVHQVAYGMARGGLCLIVRYETASALADTAIQAARGEVLHRLVETEFPEYPEVFGNLALVAFDPREPDRTWSRLVPLRRPS